MQTKQRNVRNSGVWIIASAAVVFGNAQAAKQNPIHAHLAAFSSQMPDALLGFDKYEKPIWNLHNTLGLPKWLALSVEQRTRYESMDGSFKANGNGSDQQIPLQIDVWLQAMITVTSKTN